MRPAPRTAPLPAAAEDAAQDAFRRYGAVLALLTATFTFAMIAPAGPWTHLVAALLQGGAVLAALSRARADRRLVVVAAVAVTVTVIAAGSAAAGGRTYGGISDLAGSCLLLLVPVAVVVEFRRNLQVTIGSVMAALCVYLVLGMFFATVASGVSALSGLAYFVGHPSANSADYMYFSFISLATVGYGDFVPALRLGRALAVLEGLMGQLYLVTVVALVVGNLGRRRS